MVNSKFTLRDILALTAAVATLLFLAREGLRQESALFGTGLLLSILGTSGLILHIGDRISPAASVRFRLGVLLTVLIVVLLFSLMAPMVPA